MITHQPQFDKLYLGAQGTVVVNYTYNAWGEIISTTGTLASTIGVVNKLRYRSYYYDTETGFYYLQSRYYDPIVKRFISPDSTDYLTENGDFDGYNLYAYCLNNPVMYVDESGSVTVLVLAAELAFVCVTLVALIHITSSAQFRSSWTSFCKMFGYGLESIANVLRSGGKKVFSWSKSKLKKAIAAVSLYIYVEANSNKTVKEILKTKKGSIKNAPIPPGGPHWNDILNKTLGEIKKLAQKGVVGYKEIYKLLTDSRFNR